MKVDELRTVLQQYDAAVLREIIVELYKKMPKAKKEDNGIDELLRDFVNAKSKPKVKSEKVNTVDFEFLKDDIKEFTEYAEKQYYYAPNKFVHKDERTKWRFTVKGFIKDLLSVRGEDGDDAAGLLVLIYQMLSYACHYYIFSTETPFTAAWGEQTKFLDTVLGKLFFNGFERDKIETAVFLTIDSNVDRDTLNRDLLGVLVAHLKTRDLKEIALEVCKGFTKKYPQYMNAKRLFREELDKYQQKRKSDTATELYVMLKIALGEYDDGIEYFNKHYEKSDDKRDQEIRLYCLLVYFLSKAGLESYWIREYESAVAAGIEPRKSLKEEYEKRIIAQTGGK